MIDLRLGDCLEVMATLPDGCVDAVITDPPYGIGFEYTNGREDHATPEAYWAWLQPRWVEMMRVLRPGGLFAVWQSYQYFRYYWDWYGPDIRIYAAAKNFTQLRKTPINSGWDPVVMGYKGGAEPLCPSKADLRRNIDFFVANTAVVVSKPLERVPHPCPRPLDQMREIVYNFSILDGIVIDPFMGSGTTGVACIETGRNFIGIERERQYFDIAQTRIEATAASLRQLELAV